MNNEQLYRVGVAEEQGDGVVGMYWLSRKSIEKASMATADDFSDYRDGAESFPFKFAWGWVQLLSAFHECVIIERVEVGHA